MTDSHFAGNAQLIRSARLQYGLDARGSSTCTLCLEPSERPAYIKHLQTPEVVDHAQDFAILKTVQQLCLMCWTWTSLNDEEIELGKHLFKTHVSY